MYDFTFTDFVTIQGNNCESAYTKTYSLYLDGIDVSYSLPSWISNFDSSPGASIPSFTISSSDTQDEGTYTLTV